MTKSFRGWSRATKEEIRFHMFQLTHNVSKKEQKLPAHSLSGCFDHVTVALTETFGYLILGMISRRNIPHFRHRCLSALAYSVSTSPTVFAANYQNGIYTFPFLRSCKQFRTSKKSSCSVFAETCRRWLSEFYSLVLGESQYLTRVLKFFQDDNSRGLCMGVLNSPRVCENRISRSPQTH